MKHLRLSFLFVTAALFSAAAWADGIDPKVIIQGGGGSTPITLTNPNPTVKAVAHANTVANPCFLAAASACVEDVFQNQTGVTISHLTIGITDIAGLVFSCGDSSTFLFFNNCTSSDVHGVTDLFFSNTTGSPFHGVDPAVFGCVLDGDEDSVPGDESRDDCDKHGFIGGEFSVDIEAVGGDLAAGTSITTQAITTPEPSAGLMVLFSALAFGLFKLVRRPV